MEYKSVKGFSGWAQTGFLFAFLGLGFLLAGGAQLVMTLQILPAGTSITDGEAMMKAMLAPQNVNMARAIQVVGTFLLLFIPALLWSLVCNGKNMFWLGFNKYVSLQQVIIGFLIMMAAGFAAAPLADLSKNIVANFPSLDVAAKKMEALYNEQALALSNLKSFPEYIVALFIMAFFPAMFEEVFFRGTIQNILVKWWQKPMVAIFVTSVIFSLIHLSVYLFLSRLALGFVLGLMFYYTKNIWVNIIAHFLNNSIALTGLYLMRDTPGKNKMDALEPDFHWSLSLLCVAALIGLIFLLKKYSAMNRAKIDAKENLLIAASDPFRSFAHHQTENSGA